ncbi:alpha/beta hydrolase [Roseibium salinum]|uniref:alpha/beta hydrolase n=1 Tax=Roseibium salinum TaxID=1604349 RepID=UPI003618D2A5
MRELQIQALVSDENLGLALQDKKGDTGFTGYSMPGQLSSTLKSIKLSPEQFQTKPQCLIVYREGNDAETSFAETLANAGWPIECAPFTGYLKLLATPTTSVLPRAVMSRISEFASSRFGAGNMNATKGLSMAVAETPVVSTESFTEEPVLFGPDNRMFGVVCEPIGNRRGPVMVFLNTGYCHHIGWGRIYVRAARHLANLGIASLRFDMAGIGESPSVTGRAEQVLYTDDQFEDAEAAVDYVKQRFTGPAYLIGRCSGAYVAFHTAARNPNVDGVMMINQLRMIWDPGEDIFDALNFGARPLEEYKRRALSLTTFKRLLRGQVDWRKAASHIVNHGRDRLARKASPYLGRYTRMGRFRIACHNQFRAMAARNIPVALLNCEHDGSLDELAKYFGGDLSGLLAFPNVTRKVIPDADHNLTTEAAQKFLIDRLVAVAEDPYWRSKFRRTVHFSRCSPSRLECYPADAIQGTDHDLGSVCLRHLRFW